MPFAFFIHRLVKLICLFCLQTYVRIFRLFRHIHSVIYLHIIYGRFYKIVTYKFACRLLWSSHPPNETDSATFDLLRSTFMKSFKNTLRSFTFPSLSLQYICFPFGRDYDPRSIEWKLRIQRTQT